MPGYKLINSLHARILLVICIAAFPLLAGGAYYLYRQTVLLQEGARTGSTQILRLEASYAESEIFGAGETLAAISATSAIHDRNWKLCDSYLHRLVSQRSFRYTNIGVIALDGRVLCSGVTPEGGSFPNLADRQYFQLALKHLDLAVGEYQLGRLTDVPSIAVATPLFDENKIPFAVVFVSLRLTSLQRADTKSDDQDSHVAILDRNATILTASDSLIGNVGEQVHDPLLRSAIKSQHQGVQLLTESQGAFWLVGSALAGPSSDPSALIVLYTSRGVGTLISLRRDLWLGMFVVFVLMTLALGAGWTGTNALIGRNVRRIAKAAERLRERDFRTRVADEVSGSEFQLIAVQLDEMASEIQAREQNLLNSIDRQSLQVKILRRIAQSEPLDEIIQSICEFAEQQVPGARASVLIVDKDRRVVRCIASGLPPAYCESLVGTYAVPGARSCGTAIAERRTVISEDIKNDPLWVEYRGLAMAHGLQACWSYPLVSTGDDIFGSLALYFSEKKTSHPDELSVSQMAAELAAVAIDRYRTGEALEEAQHQAAMLLEATAEGIVGLDKYGSLVFENPAACRMLGWKSSELVGNIGHQAFHHHHANGDEYPAEQCPIFQTLSDGQPRNVDSDVFSRLDGSNFPVEYSCSALFDRNDEVSGVVVSFRDITERRHAEERIRALSRVYELLSQINATIVHATDRQQIFDAICRIAADTGGFRACWIGLVRPDKTIEPASYAGAINGYLEERNTDAASTSLDHGPLGIVVNEARSIVCNDIQNDPLFPPWREKALARGYRSAAAFPLKLAGDVFGAIVFYRDAANFFNAEEIKLLDQMAADVSFAMEHLDREERKHLAEMALRDSEARLQGIFDQAAVGICTISLDLKYLRVNERYCQILGYSASELIARHNCIDATYAQDKAVSKEAIARVLAGESSVTFEKRYIRCDQSLVWVELTLSVLRTPDGKPRELISVVIDISDRKQVSEELTNSLQRFRDLASAMPMIVWSADAGGVVNFFTPAFPAFTGVSESELLEKGWLSAVHPEDQSRVVQAWMHSVTSGAHYEIEFRIRRYDGLFRWHLTRATPVRDAQGAVEKWYGTATDVHDQKLLQEKSRTLAQRLTTTLESITDVFFTLDDEWCFTYINRQAEHLFSQSRDYLLGRNIWDQLPEAAGSNFELQCHQAAEHQCSVTFDEFYAPVDKWFEVRAYPSPEGLTVYLRDTSDKRRADAQLRLLETAISRLNDIVLITEAEPIDDPGPRIVFVNDAFELRTGYRREEVIGKSPKLLQGPATQRSELDRIRNALETWQPVRAELINYTKSGQPFWIEMDIVPLADARGWYTHWVAVERDVTERHTLEERLHQSQQLESIGHLTGGVAHDFNNLLTVILGNAELICEEIGPQSRVTPLARMITEAAQRGADLTRGLLAFARRQPLEPQALDLNALIARIDALLRRTLGEQIEIEITKGEGLRAALVDPAQLESALLNLCINARDAMPRGGRLTIETRNVQLDQGYADQHSDLEPGQYVMIAVSDTGEGIPADVLPRVFEPFYTTKPKGKGTGLGLSMVYGFVKQSRGHVAIYSEPGLGTTVKMYLPCAINLPHVESQTSTSFDIGGSETILLVEDDPLVRQFAHGQLVKLGYQVLEASNAKLALRILEEREDIDLLFTDIVMPGGMSGRELADIAVNFRPGIKVLYTSGYTENAIVHHGRLDPGVQLLSKPYIRADLARKVREALQT